ncbi:glycoside hydrolase domain-containing protein [Kribbella deserti]|uniref:Glycoside hydrolase domain-containing protein n=1 Tax=Kribbella deserti TaxID=1926257 RepID=A0ABV6QNB8_9ACTN
MKRFLALLLALLLCLLLMPGPTAVAVPSGAAVRNGGFESGALTWSTFNGTVEQGNARSGTKAARLAGGEAGFEQVVYDLLPNTTYVFSGYVKTDSQEAWLGVKNYGAGRPEVNARMTSASYSRGGVTFTTGDGQRTAIVYFFKATTGNTAYGDDFELVQSQPRPDELATNGGFENGIDGWGTNNSDVVAGNARSGAKAARISGGEGTFEQTVTGLRANTKYRLSGYAKTDAQEVWIGVKNYGGTEANTKFTSAEYTRGDVIFTTGPASTSAIIYFFKHSVGNTAYGDDLSLVALAPGLPATWTEGSMASVFKDSTATPQSGRAINLVAARNEYEFGQIAMRSAGAFDIQSVTLPDLVAGSQRIAAANLRSKFVDYIYLTHNSHYTANPSRQAPGYFPEFLLNDRSRAVPGNTTQAISVTVFVPAETAPGIYQGTATVSTSAGDVRVPIRVEVADVTLPEPADSALTYANYTQLFGFEGTGDQIPMYYPGVVQYSPEWRALMQKFLADLKEHRTNGQWIPTIDLLSDGGSKVAADGTVTFRWERFDEVVQMLLDAGVVKTLIGENLLLKPGGGRYGIWGLRNSGGTTVKQILDYETAEAKNFSRQYLTALRAHLVEKGWLSRWYQTMSDEPDTTGMYDTWRRAYDELVKVHLAGVKITTTLNYPPSLSTGTFEDRLNVYVPVLNQYVADREFYQGRQAKGDEVWTYICTVPRGQFYNRFIDMPLPRMRFMNWFNFANGVTGTLYWAYSNWKEPVAEWATPGDTSVVYPDAANNTFIGTLRHDAMRDGAEEYELLAILKKRDPALAAKLVEAVAPTAGDAAQDRVAGNPPVDTSYLADKHDQLVRAAAGQAVADKTISAYDTIEAENFSSQRGVWREDTSDLGRGQHVGGGGIGDEISYDRVDFGAGGSVRFDLRAGTVWNGTGVELRLDSPTGPVLASVAAANTGGWQTFATNRVTLTAPAGVHKVYVRYTGSMNVNWLKFTQLTGNLAKDATASASSEYSAQYAAAKVRDDVTNEWQNGEWASKGESNPWVRLDWPAARTIGEVVLFDRNNPFDDARAGTLTFSDGTSVPVTGIPADGDGLSVKFPAKTVSWMRFQVTDGRGANVGLSELQVRAAAAS